MLPRKKREEGGGGSRKKRKRRKRRRRKTTPCLVPLVKIRSGRGQATPPSCVEPKFYTIPTSLSELYPAETLTKLTRFLVSDWLSLEKNFLQPMNIGVQWRKSSTPISKAKLSLNRSILPHSNLERVVSAIQEMCCDRDSTHMCTQ